LSGYRRERLENVRRGWRHKELKLPCAGSGGWSDQALRTSHRH
jgi:hypothetical protein